MHEAERQGTANNGRTRGLILLADDDVSVRNLVRKTVENEGFTVLAAADGAEALKLSLAHEGTIDLLLTDVEMPHLDGISVYRQIIRERPNIKVIFMSGGLRGRLELPGSLPFLLKPFRQDALVTKLKELLAIAPPAIENLQVILVVDQNAERRGRTNRILTDNGYAVLLSTTADEAEKIVASLQKIDLIISEVVFPGATGVDLAEQVDASARNINTLLISHFHPDILRNVQGFSKQPEFLANPYSPDELLMRVRKLLP
jgi:CheY-like chemotaxis protein